MILQFRIFIVLLFCAPLAASAGELAGALCSLMTKPVVTEASGPWLTWDPSKSAVRARMILDSSITPTNAIAVGQAQLSFGEELPLHYHAQEEIYIITRGSGRMTLGDREYDVQPGSVIFIPSNVFHRIEGTSEDEDLEFNFFFAADSLADVKYMWAILLGNGELLIEE